jgi:Na+/H+ antiporter NhaC
MLNDRRGPSRNTVALCLLLALPLPLLAFQLEENAAPDESTPTQPPGFVSAPPSLEITVPRLAVSAVPLSFQVKVAGRLPSTPATVELRSTADGRLLGKVSLSGNDASEVTIAAATPDGDYSIAFAGAPETSQSVHVRTVPGWLTLLPPLLAIVLALLFHQVVPALVAGIWIGAWIYYGGPFVAVLRLIDQYVVMALADSDHVSIVVFSLLLGGMVGIVSRSGGTYGLVDALRPYATNSRRGQLVTWLLGILVFFDDYANTLLVGNTMRPVTDRLKVSREKLAYIVDSTAAPVASIALVSTWIGYEVSLIGDSLKQIGSDTDAYTFFLKSLPYNFYPILALVFGLLVASTMRDFGSMLRAERRALGGKVLSDVAVPLSDFDNEALTPPTDKPLRWYNAVVPVLVVLVVTFGALWLTGRASLVAEGDSLGTTPFFGLGFEGLGGVFGAGDSFKALLWASFCGCVVALGMARAQGILSLGEGLAAWTNGMKSMTMAIVILILAWSIADVCSDLNTSGFMVATLSDHVDPRVVPAIVFVLAAITAFSTGTSWGTMGILIPLAVPTAHGVAAAAGYSTGHGEAILLCSVSAVLAGAIFGDHCSPISDTTVLSSMASGCDHVDHVRTQLPYAAVVGIVGILVGYIPAGFGLSPLICIPIGVVTLFALLRWLGKPIQASVKG